MLGTMCYKMLAKHIFRHPVPILAWHRPSFTILWQTAYSSKMIKGNTCFLKKQWQYTIWDNSSKIGRRYMKVVYTTSSFPMFLKRKEGNISSVFLTDWKTHPYNLLHLKYWVLHMWQFFRVKSFSWHSSKIWICSVNVKYS